MKFVDEAVVEVTAGNGGRGIVSFRREAQVPRGGPDGGSGGRGGDVIFEATTRVKTLLDHRYRRQYKAPDGQSGGPSLRSGKAGEDLRLPVPLGTLFIDEETGEVLADLVDDGQVFVLAKGGRGGRGNSHFQSARLRVPRFAQPGEPGERRKVILSLKLVADVGLVGLPNAGKSTFIRSVSGSQAKVAEYPFTTLVPNLGVVRIDSRSFVVADIPGLVAGAHEGHGLGDLFLKHVERTRVLVHLLSLSPDAPDPVEAFDIVRHELKSHSAELSTRPQVVVLNKIDLLDDRYEIDLWTQAFSERGVEVMAISGLTGENVQTVLRRCADLLAEDDPEPEDPNKAWSPI